MDVKYVCTKCGAIDFDRSATPPAALNCWSCRAGFQMDLNQMRARQIGMFPEVPIPTNQQQENETPQ